jgi:hypothetical protein
VFSIDKIDEKVSFPSSDTETMGNISAATGQQFHPYKNIRRPSSLVAGSWLGGKNLHAFIEVSTQPLNKHRVVIVAAEDVSMT